MWIECGFDVVPSMPSANTCTLIDSVILLTELVVHPLLEAHVALLLSFQ